MAGVEYPLPIASAMHEVLRASNAVVHNAHVTTGNSTALVRADDLKWLRQALRHLRTTANPGVPEMELDERAPV